MLLAYTYIRSLSSECNKSYNKPLLLSDFVDAANGDAMVLCSIGIDIYCLENSNLRNMTNAIEGNEISFYDQYPIPQTISHIMYVHELHSVRLDLY